MRTIPMVTGALTAIAIAFTATPASAVDHQAQVNDIADIIAEAAPTGDKPMIPKDSGASSAEFANSTSNVVVPLNPDGAVTIRADGMDVAISLPEELALADGVVADDGTVVFEESGDDAHAAVQTLDDGSVRLQTVLEGPNAPSTYTYNFGEGVELVLLDDGSVEVTEDLGDGVVAVTGSIEAPWAIDAEGANVPTHYTVEGSDLTQHVSHSSSYAYPITADPTYSNGWWRYVHFNKAETRTIANGGWGAAAITAVCAKAHWAAGAACLAQFGTIVYVAGTAVNSRPMKCLVLKFSHTGGLATLPGTYRDSRCK